EPVARNDYSLGEVYQALIYILRITNILRPLFYIPYFRLCTIHFKTIVTNLLVFCSYSARAFFHIQPLFTNLLVLCSYSARAFFHIQPSFTNLSVLCFYRNYTSIPIIRPRTNLFLYSVLSGLYNTF